MSRALFAMSLHRGVVLERSFSDRAEPARCVETLGRIEEASYLGKRPVGFWARLLGRRGEPMFVPPFDEGGADVHGLLRGAHPVLDGDDDPLGTVRLARGTVTPLVPREAGDDVVVCDAWSESGIRITSAIHFGVVLQVGGVVLQVVALPPVAVAFAQSPLVIAVPENAPLDRALRDVPKGARIALSQTYPNIDLASPAQVVELRVGDEVEVLGVVTTKEQCRGRFDLEGRSTSYRDAPAELSLVVGDRQGMRMVIRKTRAAPR